MTLWGKCPVCGYDSTKTRRSCGCPDNHVPASQARRMLAAGRKRKREQRRQR